MTNFNGNFNPVYNNPLPHEFADWSLDLDLDDDDRFRAGYPFSDIPEIESNESCEPYNTSPTFDNDHVQSSSSSGDICISKTEENNQLTQSSIEQQEKQASGRLEFCLIDERHKNHEIHPNQLNSYDKEKHGDDRQCDIKDQVDGINIKTIGQPHDIQTNN